MKLRVLLPTMMFAATPAFADKPVAPDTIPGTHIVNAEQLIELINTTPELVIIDARRREEYARGHIEGAIYMLDSEMTPETLGSKLRNKESPVVFYCNGRRCVRSSNAARKAVSWGYHRIYWFRGGWEEWRDKGLPFSH